MATSSSHLAAGEQALLLVSYKRPHASTQPAKVLAERRTSDEESVKIGPEFDLDAFIKRRNPPTAEEILKSLSPIPTLKECLAPLPNDPGLPCRRALTGQDATRAEELERQARELGQAGRYADALPLLEDLLDILRRGLGADHWAVREYRSLAASVRHVSALPTLVQAELAESISLHNQAIVLSNSGDDAGAESLYRKALALCDGHLGEDDPTVASITIDLAIQMRAKGDYAAAEPLHCAAVAMFRKAFGDAHPNVAQSLSKLASFLQAKGNYAAAAPLHRAAIASLRELLGDEHLWVGESLGELASCLLAQGDYGEAEALLRQVLALLRMLPSHPNPQLATSSNNLAVLLHSKGDYAAAEQLYRNALDIFRRLQPGDHRCVATGMDNVAAILQDRGALAQAESLCRDALAMSQRLWP
ncbi:MAG: tetratricopeptide repeat protein, partial [Planctomycetota bacterium]